VLKKDVMEKAHSRTNSSDKVIALNIVSAIGSNLFAKEAMLALEYSPTCTEILDRDFNLQYMNPSAMTLLNIDDTASFYGQRYPYYFYPQNFREQMTGNLNEAVKTDKVIVMEASVVDTTGKELWLSSTIIPIVGNNAKIESVLVISIDSTKCKKAEQELLQYKHMQHNWRRLHLLNSFSNSSPNRSFMANVKSCVMDNINDYQFDVNALAKQLFMSRSTLQRKLTKKAGVCAAQLIRQIRLATAHEFIQNGTHRTIAETAHAVGFRQAGYFSKLYKKYLSTLDESESLLTKKESLENGPQNMEKFYKNILSTGLEALSLKLGVISRIEHGLYKIVSVISENNIFVTGEVFRLHDTYCREVIEKGETIALTKLDGSDGLRKHPLYDQMPLEAYIATPIYKNGLVWGTLNFSSSNIRYAPFETKEISIIEKLARQISVTL